MLGIHLLLPLLPGIQGIQMTCIRLPPLLHGNPTSQSAEEKTTHTQEFLQHPGLTFVSRRRSLHSDSVSTLSNTTLCVPFICWESIVTAIPSKGKGPIEKQAQIGMSKLWTRMPQTPTPSLDKEVERHYTFSEKTGQFPRSARSLQTPHMLQGNQSTSWGSWPTARASGASRDLGLAGRAAESWGNLSALWIAAAEQVQPIGVRLWRKEAGKHLHQPSFQSSSTNILSQNYLW